MDSHYATKITFAVNGDGTVHVGFYYTSNNPTEGEIPLGIMVMSEALALDLSLRIGQAITQKVQPKKEPTEKPENN